MHCAQSLTLRTAKSANQSKGSFGRCTWHPALAIAGSSYLFIGPLPVGNVWSINAKLVGVILAGDLLIEQRLANTGAGDLEPGHPIDRVSASKSFSSLLVSNSVA